LFLNCLIIEGWDSYEKEDFNWNKYCDINMEIASGDDVGTKIEEIFMEN